MKLLKIVIGRHSFRVYPLDPKINSLISSFNSGFQTYIKIKKGNRYIMTKDKLFLVYNAILKEYYYPITALNEFASKLNSFGLSMKNVDLHKSDTPKRFKVDLKFNTNMTDRDYQTKYVNTMSKNLKVNSTFLVDLATGAGKTYIAARTISKIGYRTAILILPKYIEKWISDLLGFYAIERSDIFIVQGSDTLRLLMSLPEDKLPKFIIFSNRTMYFYIKQYETLQFRENFQFDIAPTDLLNDLKVSILLVDEAHQEFHSVYKTTLALDPTLLIGLSATLLHKDKKVEKLYELLYPKKTRLSFLEVDKYHNVVSVRYGLPLNAKFKYVSHGYGYSQTKFESSILKNGNITNTFVKMINHYLEEYYVKKRTKKQKCLIFFGSIDMCTYFVNMYKKKYPTFRVVRYVSGDSYEEMLDGDIIVSTPGSCGTAIDIPGLITTLSPFNTSSTQLNLQMLGRLRKISGVDVTFVYFWCNQIEQHSKYHHERYNLFSNRVHGYKMRIDESK